MGEFLRITGDDVVNGRILAGDELKILAKLAKYCIEADLNQAGERHATIELQKRYGQLTWSMAADIIEAVNRTMVKPIRG